MLDIANDIQSLSTFKRDTAKVAARLKQTGKPLVLTVNGKAEMVVQDAAAYQRLLDLAALADWSSNSSRHTVAKQPARCRRCSWHCRNNRTSRRWICHL